MTVILQVDIEQLLYEYLSTDSDMVALCDGRVYTVIPPHVRQSPADFLPFVRQYRVGGGPVLSRPLVLDQPRVQFDAWGTNKKEAWRASATLQAVLAELPGRHSQGCVTAVDFGDTFDAPDTSLDPPQQRYIFDAVITTKP